MRGLAFALLAGLLAVTVPPASALCVADDEGGCSRMRHMVVLDIDDTCPESARLCIVAQNESFSGAPNEADWAFRIHNGASSAITLELFAIGFYDPETGEARVDRVAAQKLATIQVPAGEDLETDFDTVVPGNVSHVRVQVLADQERQAELEAELSNVRILMMGPGDGVVDDGSGEPAGNLDDDSADADKKDTPALPLALLVLGCLAAVLVARRLA